MLSPWPYVATCMFPTQRFNILFLFSYFSRWIFNNTEIITTLYDVSTTIVKMCLWSKLLIYVNIVNVFIEDLKYHILVSSSSRTKLCILTRQSWLKAVLPPTAGNSLAKMNDHQTRRTLIILIATGGEFNSLRHFVPSRRTLKQARSHPQFLGGWTRDFFIWGQGEQIWGQLLTLLSIAYNDRCEKCCLLDMGAKNTSGGRYLPKPSVVTCRDGESLVVNMRPTTSGCYQQGFTKKTSSSHETSGGHFEHA